MCEKEKIRKGCVFVCVRDKVKERQTNRRRNREMVCLKEMREQLFFEPKISSDGKDEEKSFK